MMVLIYLLVFACLGVILFGLAVKIGLVIYNIISELNVRSP